VINIRLRSTKHGKIRFTSHRDVARIWERTLRAGRVPMVYSEGFSPRPRISFGLALPTGSESDAEYIDVQLDDTRPLPCAVAELPDLLTTMLPGGLTVTGVAVLGQGTPSLQQDVTSCVWDITVKQPIEIVNQWNERVLGAPSLVVERIRKGKAVVDDLRPLVLAIEARPADDPQHSVLRAELGTQPRSLRPSELLTALEPALDEHRLRRIHQYIERDGARIEPLEVGAAPETHTGGCAS
jgi:radical SAM-linked protein